VSVVGGNYQSGDRELFVSSAELRRSAVPQLISQAVHLAAKAEAAPLARDSIPTEPCEAWLNVLGADGNFNVLHTHAECTYSGVFFIADGWTGSDDDPGRVAGGRSKHRDPENSRTAHPLTSRLAFFAGTEELLSTHHVVMPSPTSQRQHMRTTHSSGNLIPHIEHCAPNGRYGRMPLRPIPGTCVIFPSFIPHFVIPFPQSTAGADAPPPKPRISIAFSFGACEPLLIQLFVQDGDDGDASEALKVRSVLKTV
jgi:hypothetical protein